MTTLAELKQKLVDTAADLLETATPEQQLDVFKAATTLYIGMAGKPGKQADDAPPGGTFADMRNRAGVTGKRVNGGDA